MQITIVKEEYAAQAEALDMLGKEIPERMIEEVVELPDEAAKPLPPPPSMSEIDELLARFTVV